MLAVVFGTINARSSGDAATEALAPSLDGRSTKATKPVVSGTVPEEVVSGDVQQNLALIHVPKTGGSTIETWAWAHGIRWGVTREWPASSQMDCPGWHIPRAVYTQLEGTDPYMDNTTFCVVRHPFTRAVSEYLFCATLAMGCHPFEQDKTCKEGAAKEICNATKMNAWILSELDRVDPAVRNISWHGRLANFSDDARARIRDCHWLPQWMYVGSPGQGTMCNRTLRFEQLDEQWKELMEAYFPGDQDAALSSYTRNTALCSMKVADLSLQVRAWLHELYARDFEQFGYTPNTTRGASTTASVSSMLDEETLVDTEP